MLAAVKNGGMSWFGHAEASRGKAGWTTSEVDQPQSTVPATNTGNEPQWRIQNDRARRMVTEQGDYDRGWGMMTDRG